MALFQLGHTADDLSNRKIIGCLDFGNALAAEFHHLAEQFQKIGTSAVGNQDTDVHRQTRKAVLSQAKALYIVEVADDMFK